MRSTGTPLFSVSQLCLGYRTGAEYVPVISDMDFCVSSGEIVGLIGESGSGKSTFIDAIQAVLPFNNGAVLGGTMLWRGEPIVHKKIIGRELTYVPQDPNSTFDPFYSIKSHFDEILSAAAHVRSIKERAARIHRLLLDVELSPDEFSINSFPHQLSGGMKQRILIALALITEPALIVADEPTSNLDVVSEKKIIDLFLKINKTKKTAFIMTTHNMRIARRVCERLYVIRQGRIVESGPTRAVLDDPQDEYTKKLVRVL
jgi:ABC-type dipeptide/oligopeptide/nickel transport system ATPase component